MTSGIDRVLEFCDRVDPGGVAGVYLHGSATSGGLRPDSDLDLVLVTRRSLANGERQQLTDLLRRYSGARATAAPGRPIELTSVVLSSVVPWRYPPQCDYQYGEWLRDDPAETFEPHTDPDLTVVLTAARATGKALRGPDLAALVEVPPSADLHRAIRDCLPALLEDLIGDERNVLLTLARMIVTVESGEIVSKDEAARRVSPRLGSYAPLLELARRAHLGEVHDEWASARDRVRRTAELLAASIRDRACGGGQRRCVNRSGGRCGP